MSVSDREKVEGDVRSCYSTWSGDYYRDYYQSATAYPPVHTDIVRRELAAASAKRIIDAGCGPASMLRDIADRGLELSGFDLTPEMVDEARRIMAPHGVPSDRIWQGSVLDGADFRLSDKLYDAAICFGVLPHVPAAADSAVLCNLANAVRKDGLVLLEARNQLFALFTLNRYSRDFFRNVLIGEAGLRSAAGSESAGLDQAFKEIDARFRLDLPAIRRGKSDEPGYDEVLSRTHNPFELSAQARAAGLRDVEILFYHYHCVPPLAEAANPAFFRKQSLALEDPHDWRGHFMASAFILKGWKKD